MISVAKIAQKNKAHVIDSYLSENQLDSIMADDL